VPRLAALGLQPAAAGLMLNSLENQHGWRTCGHVKLDQPLLGGGRAPVVGTDCCPHRTRGCTSTREHTIMDSLHTRQTQAVSSVSTCSMQLLHHSAGASGATNGCHSFCFAPGCPCPDFVLEGGCRYEDFATYLSLMQYLKLVGIWEVPHQARVCCQQQPADT
jgi:hypothetical protein